MLIKKETNKKPPHFSVQFPFDKGIIAKIKKCPSRKYNSSLKLWEVPFNKSSIRFLMEVFPGTEIKGAEALINRIEFINSFHQNLIFDTTVLTIKNKSNIQFINSIMYNGHQTYFINNFLYDFQQNTVTSALLSPTGFGLFADTGVGKTIMMLEIINFIKISLGSPTLLLCPITAIKGTWIYDCLRLYPSLKTISLRGETKIPIGYDIYLLNYESLEKWKNQIENFQFQTLVLDESSILKNYKSKTTKNVLKIAENVDRCYCLSGTPAPNSNIEYYAQLKLIGATNLSYYSWLETYFKRGGYQGLQWKFNKDKSTEFAKQFQGKAIFLSKNDCLSLPGVVEVPVFVDLSEEEAEIYKAVKKGILDFLSEQPSITELTALAELSKLRQVASGFIYKKTEEDKANIVSWKSLLPSKIITLKELLNSINNQVIIWVQYNHEKEQILNAISEEIIEGGYSVGVLFSDQTDKEKDTIIDLFKKKEIQILVSHPKIIGKSLTFADCSCNIFYSRSYSFEDFEQAKGRCDRNGQTQKVTYYNFIVKNTIEERIDKVLKAKQKNKKLTVSAVNELKEILKENLNE